MGPILVDFGVQNGAKSQGESPRSVQNVNHFLTCHFCSALVPSKSAQEAPKRLQDPPKSAPGGPKRLPKALQEAPRGRQETPRADQESSKPAQEPPRASQDAHKAFPKHLARQLFSENSKQLNRCSKKHRRRLRSPWHTCSRICKKCSL